MSLQITAGRVVDFVIPIQKPVWELRASIPGTPDEIIRQMQESGKLPATLTQKTVDAMKSSLKRYFSKLSSDKIQEAADKAREIVEQTLKTEESAGTETGLGTAGARGDLTAFLESMTGANVAETMNMDFFIRIAQEVAAGAGNFIAANSDQMRVDEFPAWELVRVYSRMHPRGSTGREGDDDWPTRWEAAGGDLIDGRMVALKDDDIWQALGDGEGGYEDTLGNPFPPFAFSSGMDVDEISREEAVKLGLMDDDDDAKPASIDFSDLFSLPTEARVARAGVFFRALTAPARPGFALARQRTNLGQIEAGAPYGNQNARKDGVKQTDTPEFKAWFGKSKVVDSDGKPLVVYHGSPNSDFESFSAEHRGETVDNPASKKAFYFASDPHAASLFYAMKTPATGEAKSMGVIPAYVSLENPMRITASSISEFDDKVSKVEDFGKHDGVIGNIKGDDVIFGAFHPTQIKSAIGNKGTWSKTDPNITARHA